MEQEVDPRIKQIWELHLNMEIGQLQAACDLMRRHEDRDPAELLPAEVPNVLTFESNKAYIREVLANDIDVTTLGTGYVMEMHERFEWMLQQLNDGGAPPTQRVVELHEQRFGTDYRHETEGPYPIAEMRQQVPAEAKK
jgi:hypothetical protein